MSTTADKSNIRSLRRAGKRINATAFKPFPKLPEPDKSNATSSSDATPGPTGLVEGHDGLKIHQDVWFSDGDIVIRGDDTVFRVSKELLSKSSLVFEDLFSLPQPETLDENELYDGCPMVHLPDPAEHLYHLLKGLHDASYHIIISDNRSLCIAVGVLHLSTKYETRDMRERVIGSLASLYPPKIEAYRTRWSSWSKLPAEAFDPHNIALVANAARETNALVLLPAVLFHYLEQYGRSIGSIVDAHDAGIALGIDKYEADLPLLNRDNLNSILKSRSHIIFYTRKYIYGWIFSNQESIVCVSSKCRLARTQWVDDMDKMSLDGWFPPIGQHKELQLCDDCMSEAASQYGGGLHGLWDRLPEMFDLVGWQALKRTSRMTA